MSVEVALLANKCIGSLPSPPISPSMSSSQAALEEAQQYNTTLRLQRSRYLGHQRPPIIGPSPSHGPSYSTSARTSDAQFHLHRGTLNGSPWQNSQLTVLEPSEVEVPDVQNTQLLSPASVSGAERDRQTYTNYQRSRKAGQISQCAPDHPPERQSKGEEDQRPVASDGDEDEDEDEDDSEKTPAERLAAKRKMKRFRLTHAQTRYLMCEFTRQAHPDAGQRERLSAEIPGLSPRKVQVWFQNRRAKLKRLTTDDQERMRIARALPENFDLAHTLRSAHGEQHPPHHQVLSPPSTSSMPRSGGFASEPSSLSPVSSTTHVLQYAASHSLDIDSSIPNSYFANPLPGPTSLPAGLNTQWEGYASQHESMNRLDAESLADPSFPGSAYNYERSPPRAALAAPENQGMGKDISQVIPPTSIYDQYSAQYLTAAGPAGYPPYPFYVQRQTEISNPQSEHLRSLAQQSLGPIANPIHSPTASHTGAFPQYTMYDGVPLPQQRYSEAGDIQAFTPTLEQPANNLAVTRRRGGPHSLFP